MILYIFGKYFVPIHFASDEQRETLEIENFKSAEDMIFEFIADNNNMLSADIDDYLLDESAIVEEENCKLAVGAKFLDLEKNKILKKE